jgi:hypothetical protein
MIRGLVQVGCSTVLVILCLNPVWAEPTSGSPFVRRPIREPSWVFVVGPGTIVSIHVLDLPFTKSRYIVRFATDDGQTVEVWHSGKHILLLEGMRGMLVYSEHPEKILDFRMVEKQ